MTGDEERIAVDKAIEAIKRNQFDALILIRISEPVEEINDEIKNWAHIHTKAMTIMGGSGIAAPQTGFHKRIIIYRKESGKYETLINPVIKEQSKKTQIVEESCLSFPGVSGKVRRPIEIEVEALDLNGKRITVQAKWYEAARLLHEIDHLDGILFVEKARKLKDPNKSMEQYYASYKEWLKSKNVSKEKGLTKHETYRKFTIRMIETIKQKIKQIIKRDQKMTKGDNESKNTQPLQTKEPQKHSWDLNNIPRPTKGNNNPIDQQMTKGDNESENTFQDRT